MEYGGENCPCKRIKCERHADCEACRKHHSASHAKPFTACEKPEAREERKTKRTR